MMKKIFIAAAAIILWGGSLFAQQFNATADKTVVGQNERFQIYFTLSCPDYNKASSFKAPTLSGLKILSGPNQSTSMQIVNGKMDASITLSYLVFAPDMGSATVGQASIVYDGKTYTSKPISIKVEKSSAPAQPQQGGQQVISEKEIAKNLFIVAEADKSSVHQGEQVTVTYKLYTKVNIASPQITKLPVFQGFWTEELDLRTINFDIAMYKGERFRVAVIKKAALFPTKSGQLTVSPFELKIPVQVPKKRTGGGDIFDEFFNDPFFGRSEQVDFTAKSNSLQINVLPLPQNGVPASFNGNVGSFTINSAIDKKNLKTNESATIRLTISGSGNIKLLAPPELKVPAGFEKYEPKIAETIERSGAISGQKVADYLVIPRNPGDFEIPSIEFSFFNPREKKYVTLKTESFKLHVEKGEGYVENAPNYANEDVQLLNEDIRYIKSSDNSLEKKSEATTIKLWFWIGAILSIVVFAASVIYGKRREKLYSDTRLLKFRKAEKAAVKKLEAAQAAIAKNDGAAFYEELSKAIFGYLEDKLGIEKSEFTNEKVIAELSQRQVSDEIVEKVKHITEICEFARFAPQAEGLKGRTDLYKEALTLITSLESSFDLRKKK